MLLKGIDLAVRRLKVFWFNKDNPTGHIERKKKKRVTNGEVGRQY